MVFLVRMFKILWIGFCAGFATILVFIPIVVVSFFSTTGNLPFNLSQMWAWTMLKATRVRLEGKGHDNILSGQSYIVISNHQSHFDGLALVLKLGIQFRWIVKKNFATFLSSDLPFINQEIFLLTAPTGSWPLKVSRKG